MVNDCDEAVFARPPIKIRVSPAISRAYDVRKLTHDS